MSFNLTTSAAIIWKAGEGASAVAVASGALLAKYCDQAEASVSTITQKDWVGVYADVGANYKEMLSDVTSDLAAMKVICYDMGGYFSRFEAQTILDVLRDNANQILTALKEQSIKDNVGG